MIYNILFAVVGIGLIAVGVSLRNLDNLVESWVAEMLHLTKVINVVDRGRFEDSRRLDEAFKRIQELEDRLEAHATELTEHHNKIDTLEINGSVYESLFEQQGLWGNDSDRSEFPKYNGVRTNVEEERVDDLCKLAALEQRVRVLEEKLDDHLEHSAIPEFPYPEDEEIVI